MLDLPYLQSLLLGTIQHATGSHPNRNMKGYDTGGVRAEGVGGREVEAAAVAALDLWSQLIVHQPPLLAMFLQDEGRARETLLRCVCVCVCVFASPHPPLRPCAPTLALACLPTA